MGTTLSESLGNIPPTWCSSKNKTKSSAASTAASTKKADDDDGGDDDNTVWFSWTEGSQSVNALPAQLRIGVRHGAASGDRVDTGTYYVPRNETPYVGAERFEHQVYDGPGSFQVAAYRYNSA